MKVFKIFDTETGLYSKGGSSVLQKNLRAWSKNGKTWNREGDVKSHLNMLTECYSHPRVGHRHDATKIPLTWMIVEFDLETGEKRTYSARELAERPAKK